MATLIDRILQGDSEAVIDFYKNHSPKLMKFLRGKLPRTEDAEELLNDIFLAAIDDLPYFRRDCNLNTWLFRIAHNKIADFYRKKKIKSVLLSQAPFLEIFANEISQPEFQFEKNKIRDKIEKAFLSLSLNYQKILHLHYEKKIPVKELASVFNLTFKATESMLFRARRSFRLAYERA